MFKTMLAWMLVSLMIFSFLLTIMVNDILDKEVKDKIELEDSLSIEDYFLHEKSNTKCYSDEDINISYFHKVAKMKQPYKKVASLRIKDLVLTDPTFIFDHVINHFNNLFSSLSITQDNGVTDYSIPCLLYENINKALTLVYSRGK